MVNLPGLAGSAARRPLPGHGRGQRDARLVLRRRPLVRRRGRDRARPRMVAQGADIVDVGGESTRPGAQRVSGRGGAAPGQAGHHRAGPGRGGGQRRHDARPGGRVGPRRPGSAWSTTSAAGSPTPTCPGWWPRRACPTSSCTGAGTATTCTRRAVYADVVREVHDELAQRVGAVIAEGVDPAMIVLDPGLGFSKNPAPVGPRGAQLAARWPGCPSWPGSAAGTSRCWSARPASGT